MLDFVPAMPAELGPDLWLPTLLIGAEFPEMVMTSPLTMLRALFSKADVSTPLSAR